MAKKAKKPAEEIVEKDMTTARFDKGYMVVAILLVVAFLVTVSATYFRSRYIMFYPERVAEQYCTSAVVGKDDFNSLKYTTLIQNLYLGNYFRDNYIKPVLPEGESTTERTPEELGALEHQMSDVMDAYYADIIASNTDKTLDTVLTLYVAKYVETYEQVFGEPALSAVEDDLVTCFEASVAVYSAANGVDAEQTSVEVTREYSDAETAAYRDALSDKARATYERFGLSPDAVADVCEVTYSYTANGEAYDYTCTLVKIGMQWYVDITTL